MLEAGTFIHEKYRIIKEIGKGGTSVVYLAVYEKLNQKRAIKQMEEVPSKDAEAIRQRFVAEINLLMKLDHPALPKIIDVIWDQGKYLIVMDYIEGITLEKKVSDEGRMGEEEVIQIAEQMIEVLIYLHSKTPPIIYGDLKPSNLIFKPDGRVILIDFGTAGEYDEKGTGQGNLCLGTRGYAAPEQYGGGQADERSDIYSLGVTLYFLMTGKSMEGFCDRKRPARGFDGYMSPGLEAVIKKCVQEDPGQRYQNCFELKYGIGSLKKKGNLHIRKRNYPKIFPRILLCAALFLFFCCCLHILTDHYKKVTMIAYISQAEKAADQKQVKALYKKALEIRPADYYIYESLLDHYIKPGNFQMDQAIEMMDILNSGNARMPPIEVFRRKNIKGYCEFCYSVGIGYFYHMGGMTGKKEAEVWFRDVEEMAPSDFSGKKKKRAGLYRKISGYYNTFITGNTDQSGETPLGGYREFYDVLHQLNQIQINEKSNASDVAATYLISIEVAIEIGNYAEKFLAESSINYMMLKKELDIIWDSGRSGTDRLKYIAAFKTTDDIVLLKHTVEDAKQKLDLEQISNRGRRDG